MSDKIICPNCKREVTNYVQDEESFTKHWCCICGRIIIERVNSYPTEVFKTRQIETYSFHRLEEILGLRMNSIRQIEVCGMTETIKILHDDENRGAIPYMSELHIMEKRG